jgi:hypothetical protein
MSSDGYRALLLDLDGTLARAFLRITPAVEQAVRRLARDMPVGIVSSRDHTIVGEIAARLGLLGLQVSEGGARIFDPRTHETRWQCSLATADARQILDFLESDALPFSAVDHHESVEATRDVTHWDITRITALKLTKQQAQDISTKFSESADVHTSVILRIDNGDWMVDFTHASATKGSAVARYAGLVGIEPSQVIAAGDSYNDLPLLQACGLRIAMGNAAPELKAIADYVAPTVDEDGLAVAIYQFILPTLRAQGR